MYMGEIARGPYEEWEIQIIRTKIGKIVQKLLQIAHFLSLSYLV
jgi:glutamate racemase